jgi:mono/diheme cytochrome c family protein
MRNPASRSLLLAIAVALLPACSDGVEPSRASPVAAASATSSSAPRVDTSAELTFVKKGSDAKTISLAKLLEKIPAETVTQLDPYYNKTKTYRAVPLAKVLGLAFEGVDLASQEFVLRARDGYTVPMRGALATEAGAFIAFEDVDVAGWEPIGQQRANPGPFYLVWAKPEQVSLDTHPRPYQLASIEIARFEDLFPRTVPKGIADGEPAARGFRIFKEQCILCHAINRQGGRVGPELNVPQSIVEYRPVEQIKAYIKNPLTFRYSQMPPHPSFSEGDLDDLVGYFTAMKERKDDPDAATAPSPAASASAATSASARPPTSAPPIAPPAPHRPTLLDSRE